MKDSFCNACGTPFAQTQSYPRKCVKCLREVYDNPTPVVICVQPVYDESTERLGLVIAQRAILPHIGEWTLVAGHIENNGENVREAGAREFGEETSLIMGANPRLIHDYANGKGHLIMVIEAEAITYEYFLTGKPCHENLALDVMWEPRALAFPIHTEVSDKWFNQ